MHWRQLPPTLFGTIALAVAAAPALAQDDSVVALPPFLVEEAAKGPPWRYGETAGYEILSRCRDATTRRIVDAHHQLHVLLAEILPPPLQLKLSMPRGLILYDEDLVPAASQEVIARMLGDGDREQFGSFEVGRGGLRPPAPRRHYSFLPNLRLWDRDAMMVFMIVRRDSFDPDRLALTPDYISFLVRSRVPALPIWFTSGFLSLFAQTEFQGSRLSVAPLQWIAAVPTPNSPPAPGTALLPLADFFSGRVARTEPAAAVSPLALWSAQAALFVRWGLEDRTRRAAFWRFTERSAVAGVSEKLFQECFGFDFATATAQLAAYLPVAVRRTIPFQPERRAPPPTLVLRDASEGQIARIKGDWERLEVPYVKTVSPALTAKYLEQARRTLRRAYDRDVRDAGLLAVMGLCECDAGDDAAARKYLEAAVQIGPVRARAAYELARLRLAEFCAAPAASAGRLDVAQMAAVLTPLFAARALDPPLPEVYESIADVWSRGSATPSRGHLAVLDEGVRLFPRRTSLVLAAAELNLRHGFKREAAALVKMVARTGTDSETRARIAALEAELERQSGR